jgi:hypothetical protein
MSGVIQILLASVLSKRSFDIVLTFDGSTVWTAPTDVSTVDYLVVAGGGGGGYGGWSYFTPGVWESLQRSMGGGGGAGGLRLGTAYPVTGGSSYVITVGAGGTGAGNNQSPPFGPTGTSGGNSAFGSTFSFSIKAV